MARAQQAAGEGAPQVDKLRMFFNHPGFIGPMQQRVQAALVQIPAARQATTQIVFTAHSIPLSMASGCSYEAQLRESCRLVAETFSDPSWSLVFQSRSGPPTQPWLEPDVCDYLHTLHQEREVTDVIISPIGFISDHMEVLFDLDIEAKNVCSELGLNLIRSKTVGTHPRFVQMIRELISERIRGAEKQWVGQLGPNHDECPIDCCPLGRRSSPTTPTRI